MATGRRMLSMLLGMWLGAGILVDVVATQNFAAVDRFIANSGTVGTDQWIRSVGVAAIRPVLRRNAGEVNAALFGSWEWVELGLLALISGLLIAGQPAPRTLLTLTALMLVIVLAQRFYLTPNILSLGRTMDSLPPGRPANDPTISRFWMFHGLYSGSEILKLVLGGIAGFTLLGIGKRESD